ncbi:MAG: TlpA family protein disulfide reductase [Flavobacterium sp.]|nr:MAG: TlpA family protein disulfide reductase [Flavobacterium sp.]
MKKIVIMLLAITAFACTNAQSEFSKEALSQQLRAVDGSQVEFGDILKNYKGKPLMIEVWASWCGDCVKAMPHLKEVQGAHPGVSYLFISMDKAEDKWKAGIEKHELKGGHFWAPEGMKGSFGKSINLDWIPRYIIVDKKGKIVVYRAIETDFDKIDKTLKSLE